MMNCLAVSEFTPPLNFIFVLKSILQGTFSHFPKQEKRGNGNEKEKNYDEEHIFIKLYFKNGSFSIVMLKYREQLIY